MAKVKAKGKQAESPDDATIDPPGVVSSGGHGLQAGPLVQKHGEERLRAVMDLSGDVPIERLCDEAAAAIEALRARFARKSVFS